MLIHILILFFLQKVIAVNFLEGFREQDVHRIRLHYDFSNISSRETLCRHRPIQKMVTKIQCHKYDKNYL